MSSIIVRANPGDSNDKVIRNFQKKIVLENVVPEYRERQFHKSNSEKRQERLAEKRRKIMRQKRFKE